MAIAIGIVLILFCVAVIAIPLLRSRRARAMVNPLDMIQELNLRRQSIYQELSTLKEGLQLGNVPEGEYQATSQNLRHRAAENLLLQRRWEQRLEALDQVLEAQVTELRKTWINGKRSVTCPECDAPAPASQRDCSVCGTPLPHQREVLSGGGRER
ncbi:MAG: hypothetical protein ACE5KI_06950 [Dehalococcoidia bacterium]